MTTVIIVDDQSSIREFLKINLSTEAGIQVIGMADNGQSAIAQVAEHQPDMVLMDIEMPGGIDGIEATKKITESFPQTKILLFTSQDDQQQLNRALKAGARGYILKNTSVRDIGEIIRLTAKGFFQIGPILGNWQDSQLDESDSSSSNSREYISAQATTLVGQGTEYAYVKGKDTIQAPQVNQMNQTISELTPEIFQLQETIRSQKDTISDLTSKYTQAQQEIETKLRQERNYDSYGRLAGYNYRTQRKSFGLGRQNFLFAVSFLLGVLTVAFLFFLVTMLGVFL